MLRVTSDVGVPSANLVMFVVYGKTFNATSSSYVGALCSIPITHIQETHLTYIQMVLNQEYGHQRVDLE